MRTFHVLCLIGFIATLPVLGGVALAEDTAGAVRQSYAASVLLAQASPAPVFIGVHKPGCKGMVGQPGENDCTPMAPASSASATASSQGEILVDPNPRPKREFMVCGHILDYQSPQCEGALIQSLRRNAPQPAPDDKCADLIQQALDIQRNHCD